MDDDGGSVVFGQQSIQEAYDILKERFTCEKRSEGIGNSAQLVIFAEQAVKYGSRDIAIQCIELYFTLSPPTNQFLIRAHLCHCLAVAPTNPPEENKLQDSLRSLVKAVNLAKKSTCYYFLVYNASIILWRITRPFQIPGYYHLYTNTIQHVVKSLEEIKENDFSWRLKMMRLLIKCQLYSNQKEDAIKTGSSAIHIARKHVPTQLIPTFRQLVNDGIGDTKLVDKEMKSNSQLSILHKIWKIKSGVNKSSQISDLNIKLRKILSLVIDGEVKSGVRSTSKPLSSKLNPLVLIELAELAINYSLHDIVTESISHLDTVKLESMSLVIRKQILEVQLRLKDIDINTYTRYTIQVRCSSISKCEELLNTCLREDLTEHIEHICTVLWNISLPLLQPSFHTHLYRSFSLAVKSLENINSLMYGLRTLLHFELAKISASQDKIESANEHIQKALLLDYEGIHKEQFVYFKHCVNLKSQLFQSPEDKLDKAISIIEQLKSSIDICTDGSHPLLVSIGELLAPDQFTQLLTHQSSSDQSSITTEHDLMLLELSDKAHKYESYKRSVESHTKTIDNQESKKRCLIWSELAKLSRKLCIWDVTILSSLYCLQYDNGKWQYTHTVPRKQTTLKVSESRTTKRGSVESSSSLTPEHASSTSLTLPYHTHPTNSEKMMLHLIAEVHCIYAECLVNTLHEEGLNLGDVVTPRHVGLNDEQSNQHWIDYSQWISILSKDAYKSFLRCAELGCTLHEQHLIVNSSVYMWNYHHDIIQSGVWISLIEEFRTLYQFIKQLPIINESILVCRLAGILSGGLVQQWTPKPSVKNTQDDQPSQKKGVGKQISRSSAKSKKKGDVSQLQLDPEAGIPLKEAIEICEYSMSHFPGTPLNIRRLIIREWITAKQLLQHPVNLKSLPHETQSDNLINHCRVISAVEMHKVMNTMNLYEFPNYPSLDEVEKLISGCDWNNNHSIELELYTLLAHTSHQQHEYDIVMSCCKKALTISTDSTTCNNLLLSSCASLYGQCLISTAAGNTLTIKKALDLFSQSVQYGTESRSYDNVIQGCGLAWNSSLSLLTTPSNREGIREPFFNILNNVMKLIGRRTEGSVNILPSESHYEMLSNMYQILLQVYIDKCEWEKGLELLDNAIRVSPKQLHRSLYEQKILFKSKMGRNIDGDMIKFQEESSSFRSSLWFTVATNSTNHNEQLKAYQNAIELLDSTDDKLVKIDYITEFSQWLHTNNYSTQYVMDHLQWAVELLVRGSNHTQYNIMHLDKLIILHVMMMEVVRGNDKRKQYCLQALGYCILIWKGLLTDNSSSTHIPQSTHEWTNFTIPDEVITLLKSQETVDELSDEVPSCYTIKKPLLTFYYLERLVTCLYNNYLHTLSLPILHYQLLISQYITKEHVQTQLVHLRLSDVCHLLYNGVSSSIANDYYNKTDNIFLHPQDIARVHTDMVNTPTDGHVITDKGHVTTSSPLVISNEVCLWRVWLQIAYLLLQQGQYQPSRELLHQVNHISQVYNDEHTTVKTLLLMAELSVLEKRPEDTINIITQVQNLSCDTDDWIRLINILCCVYEGKTVENMLMNTINTIHSSSCDLHMSSCDLQYIRAVIYGRLASITESLNHNMEEDLLSCIEYLQSCGYYTEAKDILHTLADYYRLKCNSSSDESNRYLLKAVIYSRRSVKILQQIYEEYLILCQSSSSVVPPIQRDLITAQFELCNILLIVLKRKVEREKQSRILLQQKSSIEKMISQFLQETPLYNDAEQQWRDIEQQSGEEGLSILSNTFSLCLSDQHLMAQCLLCTGLFLYQMSYETSPDTSQQWNTMCIESNQKGLQQYSTLSTAMRKQQAENDQLMERSSMGFLIQSVDMLVNSISLSLQNKQLDIVCEAALQIVDIIGCYDTVVASSYLSLYQSCVVSQHLHDVLRQILTNPRDNRLANLLHQEASVKYQHTLTSEANRKLLEDKYEVWRRLQVNVKHNELLKLFNYDMRFIILQHSPNKKKLYAGYLIPPQPPPVLKKGQPIPETDLLPVVCCSSVSLSDLNSLKGLMKQYQQEIRNSIQKTSLKSEIEEEMLQTQFDCVVAALESYLSEVTISLTNALKREDTSKELSVVLLVDNDLTELPLEALGFLHINNITGVSRDFSLQFLYHRISKMTSDEGVNEDKKKGGDKYQPQPTSVQANTTQFKYILDPRDDLQSSDEIKSLIQNFNKITSKWNGISGSDHIMSCGEWYPLLSSSTGIILICSENVLSHYNPQQLASLNLSNCSIVILQDQMTSNTSYRTQAKLDSIKSNKDVQLEDPLVAIMLFSLCGVNCITTNQWYTSVQQGTEQMKYILKEMLSKPTKTGQLHWINIKDRMIPQDHEEDNMENDIVKNDVVMERRLFNTIVYGLPHLTLIPVT